MFVFFYNLWYIIGSKGEKPMFENAANVRFIQKINRVKVLDYIRKYSPVSRNELSKATGLSLSSITNIVSFFMDSGLVTETGRIKTEGAGRKAVKIEFTANAMSLIAINIETDEATISLTDLSGGIISSESVALSNSDSADKILSALEKSVIDILNGRNDVKAIGFAVSGHVSADGKVSSGIMHWDCVDVKGRFEKSTGLAVYISNNTKTKGLWTLRALNDETHKNIIFLDTSSDGIGIINAYNGEINDAVAGEFGHTIISDIPNKCVCGNTGCLESVCSVSYVESRYKELSGERADIAQINTLAKNGDGAAVSVMDEACRYMSAAMKNLVMIFEPDLIIVNASELFNIEALYNTATEAAIEHATRLAMKVPDFRKVNVASLQSAQGAAQIAADRLLGIDGPDDIL